MNISFHFTDIESNYIFNENLMTGINQLSRYLSNFN